MEKFYLGSDVSKGYADFLIIDSKKQVVEKYFQLGDNFEGHNDLFNKLCKFMEDHPDSKLYAAVESTGGYENNWYNLLFKSQREIDISVTRLNPIGVHHSIKANMKRNVTDRVSARAIAEYLIEQGDKIKYDADSFYTDLRKQKKFIDMLTKQKVQLENLLESVLYSANPEVLVHCRKKKPHWLYTLLLMYPTAEKLSRAHVDSIKKIAYVKDKLAAYLLERAKKSVACESGAVTETIIKEMVNQILNKEEVIKKHQKIMAEHCNLEEVEILKSIPGVGDYSAISLILEIGLIERFSSVKKLVSHFGLHPAWKKSGDGTYGNHMSKQGRSSPRATLYMVVFSALHYNPVIKEVYEKHMKKGMKSRAAMGVCMHKVLRIIYGMLKSNTKFDPAIDRDNQNRKQSVKPKLISENANHNMNIMFESPISRRQFKKRKAQLLSQDVESSKAGS